MKINIFFKFSIHKGTFNVYMIYFEGLEWSIGEEDLNGFNSRNSSKGFIMNHTFNLGESFSHKSCFVVYDYPSVV